MANETGRQDPPGPQDETDVKRRGLLRLGTLITAFTGASAISAFDVSSAHAGPGDKTTTAYVPAAEKGAASGVATLDLQSKIPSVQIPDLSNSYGPKSEDMRAAFAAGSNGNRYSHFGAPQHEDGAVYKYPSLIVFGSVEPPPPALAPASKGFDVVAHWYNDFGLDSTALATGSANGWYGWYDWNWNFPTNTGDGVTTKGYDPSRHPIQGFYKGDDANVLGWQCLWMAEAGINVVSITQAPGFTSAGWSSPRSINHWVYQLFNNTPNFAALQYMLWLKYNGTPSDIEAQNDEVVAAYATYPGAYSYSEDGKTYAVVYTWDLERTRGVYDAYIGHTATLTYLKTLAAKFRTIGYDGILLMARNGGVITSTTSIQQDLRTGGVIAVSSEYSARYGSDASYGNSYATYAENVSFPTAGIVNVVTSARSAAPHLSAFNLVGNTPALFKKVLQKAVGHIIRNNMRRIVTIYNVSEWAEGGSGLLPNKKDGFGYLDAVRSLPVAPIPRSTTSRPGTILGITNYRPSTDVVFGATGASLQDATPGNLSVTFIAPESGSIRVCMSGVGYSSTADESVRVYWALREGGNDVPASTTLVTSGTAKRRSSAEIRITGLVPKGAYTYKWTMRAGDSSQSVALAQGPNFGASSMVVIATD
ncbi:hypothetical protein FBY31_1797 [Arthrobacter sp. SLBN-100]|uniref:hypothetical protein n=1 Tax=Arthrobacter sp. SLBN-100 TaxID=2768450 RepID=UPI001151DA7E|nr:hypothetical protein [Arthrobacter sp. SLBN-100]TQJ67721.1 hypothetical protein FBY31_1797 [Arthrobacter sp. SLBN-100]